MEPVSPNKEELRAGQRLIKWGLEEDQLDAVVEAIATNAPLPLPTSPGGASSGVSAGTRQGCY